MRIKKSFCVHDLSHEHGKTWDAHAAYARTSQTVDGPLTCLLLRGLDDHGTRVLFVLVPEGEAEADVLAPASGAHAQAQGMPLTIDGGVDPGSGELIGLPGRLDDDALGEGIEAEGDRRDPARTAGDVVLPVAAP